MEKEGEDLNKERREDGDGKRKQKGSEGEERGRVEKKEGAYYVSYMQMHNM